MDVAIDSQADKYSIDLGLHFAFSRMRLLLSLCILPVAVKLLMLFWQLNAEFDPQNFFLGSVINLLADTWLVFAAVLLSISAARDDETLEFRPLAIRALQYLPKPFISYCLLFALVACGLLLLPLFMFVIFFIWAPYFCMAECLIPAEAAKDDDEEGYIEEEDDTSPTVVRWLSRKELWELGFARSVHLSGQHVWLTLQVVLLIWFVNVVPVSVLGLLTPTYEGAFSLTAKAIVSSVTMVFVSAVAGVVFTACLPPAAREELGVAPGWEWKLLSEKSVRFRFQGRPSRVAIVFAMSLLASYSLYSSAKAAWSPPQSLQSSLDSVRWSAEALRLEVRFSDPDAQFAWLSKAGFQLQVEASKESKKESGSKDEVQEEVTEAQAKLRGIASEENTVLLPLEDIKYKNPAGNEVALLASTRLEQRGTLVFYFDVPKKLAGTSAKLLFLSQFGDRSELLKFVLPKA